LVSFIVALFGIPFSFKSGRTEGIVKGIGTSIVISIFFILVFYIGISLGRAGIFPPFFAAWIGNLLFGASGLYMLISIRQ
jgi:lipopolysaccharide export LptBFGC system permease protein LptF